MYRSDFTPYKSDFASQSPAFVNDVDNPYIRASQVGTDPVYNHIISHPVVPHYTKGVSVDHSIRPDIFTDLQKIDSINDYNHNNLQPSTDNFGQEYYWNDDELNYNNEWECKIRVSKLLQMLNLLIGNSDNYLPDIDHNEV